MPGDYGGRAGAGEWVRRHWRALVGETVATALLVLLGCMTLLPHNTGGEEGLLHPPLTHPALGFGFLIAALVQVFGGLSGAHMNPAVTLTALLLGELGAGLAAAYAGAQCVGATLGFGALVGLMPGQAVRRLGVGPTAPGPGVSALQAVGVEAAMTGLLALLCCSAWRPPGPGPTPHDPAMPVKFGLLVAGLVYAGGWLTGTSLNPARSLAPALWYGSWTAHWVYWVGPLLGAAVATLLYRWVLLPPRPGPPTTPEGLPLHDKP